MKTTHTCVSSGISEPCHLHIVHLVNWWDTLKGRQNPEITFHMRRVQLVKTFSGFLGRPREGSVQPWFIERLSPLNPETRVALRCRTTSVTGSDSHIGGFSWRSQSGFPTRGENSGPWPWHYTVVWDSVIVQVKGHGKWLWKPGGCCSPTGFLWHLATLRPTLFRPPVVLLFLTSLGVCVPRISRSLWAEAGLGALPPWAPRAENFTSPHIGFLPCSSFKRWKETQQQVLSGATFHPLSLENNLYYRLWICNSFQKPTINIIPFNQNETKRQPSEGREHHWPDTYLQLVGTGTDGCSPFTTLTHFSRYLPHHTPTPISAKCLQTCLALLQINAEQATLSLPYIWLSSKWSI